MRTREIALALGSAFLIGIAGAGVNAQEEAEPKPEAEAGVGHLRIVNTIPLETKTKVQLGAVKMMGGQGMEAGTTSGILSLYAKPYRMVVENPLCTPPSINHNIEIEAGKTFAVVLYTDIETADDGTVIYELKVLDLKKQAEHDEPSLVLVSLSAREAINLNVRGKVVTLRSKQPKEIEVKLDEIVSLNLGQEPIESVEILSPVNYIAFLFDEPKDKGLKAVVLQHKKIVYDPPRESFDD